MGSSSIFNSGSDDLAEAEANRAAAEAEAKAKSSAIEESGDKAADGALSSFNENKRARASSLNGSVSDVSDKLG